MTNKAPATQFYIGDWWRAVDLKKCCMSTQGTWVNALFAMWDEQETGKIAGTKEEICRLLGCNHRELNRFLEDNKQHEFADVTIRNRNVIIINRRMHRAYLARLDTKKRVQEHRERKSNANVTPYSSTSSSTSSSKNKYMEFVFLSDEEHKKLIDKFGEQQTQKKIEALNDYIGSKGKRYKSHYHTILMWSKKDPPEQQQKICIVCRADGFKYQLDRNNKPIYLCDVCLGFFGNSNWGRLPLGQIERIVLEAKAKR